MPAGPKAGSASPSEPGVPGTEGCRPGFRYPKRAHLRKTDEISSVFDFRRRLGGVHLSVHVKPNGLGFPRLAVMVPRRVAVRAVDRNYMRRALREIFRTAQATVGGFDVVVRVTRIFGRQDFAAVRAEFLQLLSRLCPSSSSS